MRVLLAISVLSVTASGCAHGQCRGLGSLFGCESVIKRHQPERDDLSIVFPYFHAGEPSETVVDGFTLRAIQVAANDFLDPDPDPGKTRCEDTQQAHEYRAIRRGEIVFVQISSKPQNCGERVSGLDGDAYYAVSLDGRILRRAFGGRPVDPEAPGVEQDALTVPASEVGKSPAPTGEVHLPPPAAPPQEGR